MNSNALEINVSGTGTPFIRKANGLLYGFDTATPAWRLAASPCCSVDFAFGDGDTLLNIDAADSLPKETLSAKQWNALAPAAVGSATIAAGDG